jgi:hypothetical protein
MAALVRIFLLLCHRKCAILIWVTNRRDVSEKFEVWQGTLALVLKTLETMGLLHGYGIARPIEQTSGDLLSVNFKLESLFPPSRFHGGAEV